MKLWAVLVKNTLDGKRLSGSGEDATCEGIFTSSELAAQNCPRQCGIMLFELDKPWPTETLLAEEFFYPHLETREEGKKRLSELKGRKFPNMAA